MPFGKLRIVKFSLWIDQKGMVGLSSDEFYEGTGYVFRFSWSEY